MKKYIFIVMLAIFTASIAAPALADSGCGLGAAPRSKMSVEQKKQWTPPFFVRHEIDGDGKIEGRSDSLAMIRHNNCVAAKKDN